jgi:hypothetical protein
MVRNLKGASKGAPLVADYTDGLSPPLAHFRERREIVGHPRGSLTRLPCYRIQRKSQVLRRAPLGHTFHAIIVAMADKKSLEPLIPLDDLRSVLRKIVEAPRPQAAPKQVDGNDTSDVQQGGPRESEARD